MENKRVSVVMCTYNGEQWLPEQIESILNQTYPIYELLIQDDMSTDSTKEIATKYSKDHPNIHLLLNSQKLGPHGNFLDILPKATGDYIAISDQDDIWELNKIEKLITSINCHSMAFGLSKSFGDGIKYDPEIRVPNVNTFRLLFYPIIPGHSMLFKREIINNIPENCSYQVYDLLLALSACIYGSVTVVPEVLTHHRRHACAYSYSQPKNYTKNIANIVRYTIEGISGYFRKKEKIKFHFTQMNNLLNEFSVSDDNTINGEALRFSLLMSKGSLPSIIQASKICYRHRNQIFYAKTEDNLFLKIRAILCPLLCSEYY